MTDSPHGYNQVIQQVSRAGCDDAGAFDLQRPDRFFPLHWAVKIALTKKSRTLRSSMLGSWHEVLQIQSVVVFHLVSLAWEKPSFTAAFTKYFDSATTVANPGVMPRHPCKGASVRDGVFRGSPAAHGCVCR